MYQRIRREIETIQKFNSFLQFPFPIIDFYSQLIFFSFHSLEQEHFVLNSFSFPLRAYFSQLNFFDSMNDIKNYIFKLYETADFA